MKGVQLAVEYLLLGVFVIVRPALVLQGLAFGAAAAAALPFASGAWPDWLTRAVFSSGALSVTLFITGLLLSKARRWEPAEGTRQNAQGRTAHYAERPGEHDAATWPVPFGLTLVLIAALAVYTSSPLVPLWSEILARLDGNVDWGGLSRPAPNAGLIILPILVGLMVPALVTLAALAAIVLPLALLVLLPNRRPRFMTLVGMSAVCQAGLSASGWLAARMLARLVEAAGPSMRDSGDAEVVQIADRLTQASASLEGMAFMLLAPGCGLLLWLLALRPWQHATGPRYHSAP